MNTTDQIILKNLRAFAIARRVNAAYWEHAGDEADNRVSIENLQKIVENIAKLPVEKNEVEVDEPLRFVSGRFHRFHDKVVIDIPSQGDLDKRFSTVKRTLSSIA
jgi:hypothetical protein